MAILVTGGAGFIGSHLVERLAGRGERVVIVDDFNDYYSVRLKRANAEAVIAAGDVTVIEADIRDVAAMQRVFDERGIERVIHLAGARGGAAEPCRPPSLRGRQHRRHDCPARRGEKHKVANFTFASSSRSTALTPAGPVPRGRAMRTRRASPYGATKRAGELLVYDHHFLYGIKRWPAVFHRLRAAAAAGHGDTQIHAPHRGGQKVPVLRRRHVGARLHVYRRHRRRRRRGGGHAFGFEIFNLGDSSPVSLSCYGRARSPKRSGRSRL